jgi:uncharacterized protein YoxC
MLDGRTAITFAAGEFPLTKVNSSAILRNFVPISKQEKEAMTELVSTLANDLAQCLVGAFENLQELIVGESRKFNSAVQQQLERLQSTVDDVAQLRQPVHELVAAVAEQRKASAEASERFGQIAAAVSSLKQSDARVTAEIETLRGENRDLQMAVGAHSEELGTIKSIVTEASRRVTGMVEILERQGQFYASCTLSNPRVPASWSGLSKTSPGPTPPTTIRFRNSTFCRYRRKARVTRSRSSARRATGSLLKTRRT